MLKTLLKILSLFSLGIGVVLCVFGLKILYTQLTAPPRLPVDESWLGNVGSIPRVPVEQLQQRTQSDIIYGFVPYWTVKDVTPHPQLTHIGYFGLPIDKNGNFITNDGDGAQGWRVFNGASIDALRAEAQSHNQKFEVLITMMDADDIYSFLNNTSAQENFIEQMKTFIKSQPVDGVNIDIEYAGEVDDEVRAHYTNFIKKFRTETKKVAPDLHISLDVFADSGLKKRVWDISALEPYVDHIVIMMYDFYRSSSPQAGPVAPIFGAEQRRWDIDAVSTLKPFLEKIAPEKLLLVW
jgi:GH18 family chitinase